MAEIVRLQDLPFDLIIRTLASMDHISVISLSKTCRAFRLLTRDSELWRLIFTRSIPCRSYFNDNMDWRGLSKKLFCHWKSRSEKDCYENTVIFLVNFGGIEIPYPCFTHRPVNEVLLEIANLFLREKVSQCSLHHYFDGIAGQQIAALPSQSASHSEELKIGDLELSAITRVLLHLPKALPHESQHVLDSLDINQLLFWVWFAGGEEQPFGGATWRSTALRISRTATIAQLREQLAALAGLPNGGTGCRLLTPCGYVPDEGAGVIPSSAQAVRDAASSSPACPRLRRPAPFPDPRGLPGACVAGRIRTFFPLFAGRPCWAAAVDSRDEICCGGGRAASLSHAEHCENDRPLGG